MPRKLRPHLANVDLREVILDTTDALLARYGYARFTMDDLARQVGIGKATVYLQFAGKDDVVMSVIARVFYRVLGALRRIAEEERPAAARLREMLVQRVLIRYDSFSHYQDSLHELLATLRPALQGRREQHGHEEAEIFAAVIRDGMGEGSFGVRNADATAATLLVATESLLPSNLSPRELGAREEIARRAGALADLLVAGVIAGPPAATKGGRRAPRPKRT